MSGPDAGRAGPAQAAPAHAPVITLVRFTVTGPTPTGAVLRELLERTAPRYATIPGLVRKWFLGGEGRAGGLYEWRSRAAAEAWFDARWHCEMRERYGAEPTIEWFDVPCVVDNASGRIEMRIDET